MKKLSVYIMAIASMGIAMTSCNKEENTVAEPITVTLEENEILNDAKVHQMGETYTYYWDEGDQIRFIDQNGYAAIYKATRMAPRAEFDFVQNVNTSRPFDRSNGPIIGIYPWNVGVNAGAFTMPKVQNSVAGELYKDFPLYAEQPLNPSYEFKNLCGVAKIVVSGDVAIDSISVTTDQVINGDFRIDMTDPNNPVISPVQPNGHGTKTITLKVENPEVPAAKAYKIAMPPAEYKTFVITFYAGNTQFVKRYQNISIIRTAYTTLNINTPLSGANFSANPVGTINGAFSVSANQTVRFAKGNLQYVAVKGHPFWHIADNQWDYLDVINQRQGYGGDRDLISWGANRYNVANNDVAGNTGNSYAIWNRVGTYNYLPGTDALAGINEWGNNAIENGGNAANLWRTLTAAEWDYLLNTRSGDRFLNAELTIGAMTVKGLIIFPDGYSTNYAGVNNATEASVAIAMSDWFNMEADGCVFLPINTYGRDVNAQAHFPENSGSMSYYWTATPDSDTEANAIKLSKTTGMNAEVIAKRCGAFIRLVQNI